MSFGKSKTSSTTSQQQNQTATTTPNVPPEYARLFQQYGGQVGALMNDNSALVPGASALQEQAFAGAGNLSTNPLYGVAANMAYGAGNAPANTAGWAGYSAAPQAQTQGYTAAQGPGVQAYDPAQATAQGYTAAGAYQPQGYDPAQSSAASWQAQTGQAAQVGQAQTYNPTLGQASSVDNPYLFGGAQLGQAAQIDPNGNTVGRTTVGPVGQAGSRSFTGVDLNQYMNGGLGDLISAQTADFDANAGRARADQSRIAAANGGARNSGNSVREAVLEAEMARARDSALANTRFGALDRAASLADSDLGREAQTSIANAGFTTQGALAQAGIDAQREQSNAQFRQTGLLANMEADNAFRMAQGGFNQQAGLAGMDALNTNARLDADARNQFGMANMQARNAADQFGATANNNFALTQAGFDQDMNRANMDARNTAASQNAGFQQQTGMANQQAMNDALSQLFGIQAQSGLDFAARQDQANQFGAQAGNTVDMANAAARNAALEQALGLRTQVGMDQAGRQDAASRFEADSFNQAARDFTGRTDAASSQNAQTYTQNQQFNAGQNENALARALQSAGLLGDLGQAQSADQRAIVELQALLGGQQRDIASQQSPAARLAMISQLMQGIPLDTLTGRTVTSSGSGTSNSKGSTTQFGASLGDIMNIAALF